MDKVIRNDHEFLEALKEINGNPQGTEKIIRMQWVNPYLHPAFIEMCIKDLQTSILLGTSIGERPSALETLGILALYDLVLYNGYTIDMIGDKNGKQRG